MATPFLAQIDIFSFAFAPKGYAQCNGQLLPINQNQALFSLLGTNFGGDGRVNFGLPDLRSRVAISMGNGHTLGERGGEEAHTISIGEMAQHNHPINTDANNVGTISVPAGNTILAKSTGTNDNGGTFAVNLYGTAPGNAPLDTRTITPLGGSQPHTNLMPYLCLNMCIALQGIFPSQN